MDLLQEFFSKYQTVFDIVKTVFFVVLTFLLYRKTGNINYLKEALEKMSKETTTENNIVFKTPNTFRKTQGQVYSPLVPVLRLNKVSGELEETGDFVNVDEIAKSCEKCALETVLDEYLPKDLNVSEEKINFDLMQDDLDMLQGASETAEMYREKYHLSEDMSFKEIFDFVAETAKVQKSRLELLQKRQAEIQNIKKGVKDDEKEVVEKSEQA